MRVPFWLIVATTLCWADPPIPSYEYQGPPRTSHRSVVRRYPTRSYTRTYHARTPVYAAQTTPSYDYSGMTSSRSQRPAPAHYAGWGGTVVSSGNGPVTITSNGSVPEDSTVCIGRGQRYLGQGRLVNGNHIQAPGVAAQPGDWVSLVSVPRPPEQTASAYSSSGYYHSTSTNADPRYQQWLRQGFTLGRWSSRPYSSRSPYRTRY